MPRPARIVDAHVHHWDPSRVDWYPYLSDDAGLARFGMSDISGMRGRPFGQREYLAGVADWNVEKYVHVACTVGHHIDETHEIDRLASKSDAPLAIIGAIDPHATAADVVAQLDAQSSARHFRGIRIVEAVEYRSNMRALLAALQERGLVYDLVVHPDRMMEVAEALEDFERLTVVVEHTGWPQSEDHEHFELWRRGIMRLAGVGERVHCKLSGLAMMLNRFGTGAFRPWVEHCIEVFGDRRCFFASNFPVDGMCGSFDELYTVYDELTATLSAEARNRLFATNAERVYRV